MMPNRVGSLYRIFMRELAAWRMRVWSPGARWCNGGQGVRIRLGTEVAGLHELERGCFRGTLISAVEAAANRSAELGMQI